MCSPGPTPAPSGGGRAGRPLSLAERLRQRRRQLKSATANRPGETEWNEAALVESARRGDLTAFERLVLAHQDRLFRVAHRLLGNPEDAEDAAQEAFLRAFRSLRSFRGGAKFSTWLFRILLNVCRTAASRRGRLCLAQSPAATDLAAEASEEACATDPPEVVVREETRRKVREALLSLPRHYREVAVLFEIEGLPYEEIAAALGIPMGTVRSRLNRARLLLRESLRAFVELT